MPTIGDTTVERFTYTGITMEQWKELKQRLFARFKFPMKEDIGKVEYGQSTYDWQRGIFEWEFRVDHNQKPEIGVLEFGIRRRPFDNYPTNLEEEISEFARGNKIKCVKVG